MPAKVDREGTAVPSESLGDRLVDAAAEAVGVHEHDRWPGSSPVQCGDGHVAHVDQMQLGPDAHVCRPSSQRPARSRPLVDGGVELEAEMFESTADGGANYGGDRMRLGGGDELDVDPDLGALS